MLRTNSKQARANLMQYIRSDLAYLEERQAYQVNEERKPPRWDLENDNHICAFIWEIFKQEKRHEIEQSGLFPAFKDWASGLALGQLFRYWYEPARPILGAILEETEAEQERFSESEAEEMLTRLLYREILDRASYAK